ncbi:hypothetical protein GBAR_LOCUS30364 [Geodia barretti]|uniref:Uncharacterized protein n=1 Tax=Geodia barretti TaxID=519541 RepID=A0AA35XKS1_GEOBA|nr:hypothetical protein GBAR_LOCUS30364 [Geodia barretti]
MTWSVNRRRPSLSVSHGPPDLMSPSPPPLEWWLLLMMMRGQRRSVSSQ